MTLIKAEKGITTPYTTPVLAVLADMYTLFDTPH